MDAPSHLIWEEAKEEAALAEVYRFRYTRYFGAKEHLPGTDHANKKVVLPHDSRSTHYLVRTGDGKLAAVGSATAAEEPSLYAEWREVLELSRLASIAPWLVIISRLVVGEENRFSSLFGQFCLHLASSCTEKGFHYAAHYCAPPLAPIYERLGYRLYGRGKNLSNGGPFRLPMLLVVDDAPHMERLRSLFRTLNAGLDREEKKAWAEKAFTVCPELRRPPLCALTAAERRERLVSACPQLAEAPQRMVRRLERGTLFDLTEGDVLAPESVAEGSFFLLTGSLRVGEGRVSAGTLVRTGGAPVRACGAASVVTFAETGEDEAPTTEGRQS